MLQRHLHSGMGRAAPGGILISDVFAYDWTSRIFFGTFFRPIAADVARALPEGGRVLEVGSGPGHLAIQMASAHGLDVVGLDLDAAMIERARGNAARTAAATPPSFVVGDVASLPFPDDTFDVVVSTLSMHHWEDPSAGLNEIARVLKPGGRALIWDLGPGAPLHRHAPDPSEHLHMSPLEVVDQRPWRWPWIFSFTQRIELARTPASA